MTPDNPESSYRVHVSLLYPTAADPALPALTDGLARILGALSLPVSSVFSGSGTLRLATSGPDLVLAWAASPSDAAGVRRPVAAAAADTTALRRLDRHRAVLSIGVLDGGAGRALLTRPQCAALVHRLVRHLQGLAPATLVLWGPTGTLYLAEEFAALHGRAPPVPVTVARGRGDGMAETAVPDGEIFNRLDRVMPAAKNARTGSAGPPGTAPAGPAVAPPPTAIANDTPHIPPPMTDVHDRLRAVFRTLELPRDAGLGLAEEGTADNLPRRLSVYVMNGTVMVMSFPVGMGLLTYNILKGESLTVTARMMALTGLAVGMMGFRAEILQMLPLPMV